MDSMDYQTESMPADNFEALPNAHRCPYAFQPGSISNANLPNFPPHMMHRPSYASAFHYASRQNRNQPPTNYPFLPPPLRTSPMVYPLPNPADMMEIPWPGIIHPQERGLSQHLNMPENAETRSNSSASWQSNSLEGAPQVQGEASEAWRSSAASNNSSMAGVNGSNTSSNARSHDRSVNSNSRVLPPPIPSSFDRSTRSFMERRLRRDPPPHEVEEGEVVQRHARATEMPITDPPRYELEEGEVARRRARATEMPSTDPSQYLPEEWLNPRVPPGYEFEEGEIYRWRARATEMPITDPSQYEFGEGGLVRRRLRATEMPSTTSEVPPSNPRPRERLSESSTSSTSTSEELENLHSLLSAHVHEPTAGAIEEVIDRIVPPLENETTLRMDDPRRLEHAAYRMSIFRTLAARGHGPPKKPGASKTALASLVKIPIEEIEEDDRACKICYNDYGVENPEGVTESPIQLPKCKHTFGEICLKRWLEEKSTCPYCRDELPPDPYRARPGRSIAEYRRTMDESRASRRLIRMNQLEARLVDHDPERNADSHSANFASQNRTITPRNATPSANQNSPIARGTREWATSSRESGPDSAITWQPQMPMRTPVTSFSRVTGNDSTYVYTGPINPGIRVGTYHAYQGDIPTLPDTAFGETEFPAPNLHSQNQPGAFDSYPRHGRRRNSFGYRNVAQQARNHRAFDGYLRPYDGSGADINSVAHFVSNRAANTSYGRDNSTRTFFPGTYPHPHNLPESNLPPVDTGSHARPHPQNWAHSTLPPVDTGGNASPHLHNWAEPTWRQSNANEDRYSPLIGHEFSRDHGIANSLSISQGQADPEQTALDLHLRTVGDISDERFPGNMPPHPRAHSHLGHLEADYQNSRNESTDGDHMGSDYHDDRST